MSLRNLVRPRWLLGTLLVAGAALFAIGVAAERNANAAHHSEHSVETTHTEEAGAEAGDAESSGESVLGLDLESDTLVVAAVVASLLLAVFTSRRHRRGLLLATMVFAAAFTIFDVAEIAHQAKERRTALALLVAAVAMMHAGAAVVAQQRWTAESDRDSRSETASGHPVGGA